MSEREIRRGAHGVPSAASVLVNRMSYWMCVLLAMLFAVVHASAAEGEEEIEYPLLVQINTLIGANCALGENDIKSGSFGSKLAPCVPEILEKMGILFPAMLTQQEPHVVLYSYSLYYIHENHDKGYCTTIRSHSTITDKSTTKTVCSHEVPEADWDNEKSCRWIEGVCMKGPRDTNYYSTVGYWIDEEKSSSISMNINRDVKVTAIHYFTSHKLGRIGISVST